MTVEATCIRDGAADLLERAADGDGAAWDALVDRYGRLIWAVTCTHHLDEQDADDVFQTTWLRLLEHVDSIHEPEALPGWLSTTARREVLRLLERRGRLVLTENEAELERAADEPVPAPDASLLLAELQADVQRALTQLPPRSQRLLRLLMVDPPLHYREIADALEMPVGSIGPSRARCLRMLRDCTELQALASAGT